MACGNELVTLKTIGVQAGRRHDAVAATANSHQVVSSSSNTPKSMSSAKAGKLQSCADTVLQRNENNELTLVGVSSFELVQEDFLL